MRSLIGKLLKLSDKLMINAYVMCVTVCVASSSGLATASPPARPLITCRLCAPLLQQQLRTWGVRVELAP